MVTVALFAAGCGGGEEEEATPTPAAAEETAVPADGAQTAGRDQFTTTCGGCHTLQDAGTNGQVGPNLDEVQPSPQQVLSAIESGPGQMPENLLQGEDAQQVAAYVASSAGG